MVPSLLGLSIVALLGLALAYVDAWAETPWRAPDAERSPSDGWALVRHFRTLKK
jgi:hypothetical protein